MGFFDMIFGRKKAEPQPMDRPVSFGEGPISLGGQPARGPSAGYPAQAPVDENEQALRRYRYMLNTAPPETIEQAHAEAFERMTPQQRAYVLQALANELPESERAAAQLAHNDPRAMARVATRAELRRPGTMERTLSAHPAPGGMGAGGMMAGIGGTLLMSFAAGFVGSMAASAFLDAMGDPFADVAEAVPEELPVGEEEIGGGFEDFGGGFEEF
jgi:hypothetical protein